MEKLKSLIVPEVKKMLIIELKRCQLLDLRNWIHATDSQLLEATKKEPKDASGK